MRARLAWLAWELIAAASQKLQLLIFGALWLAGAVAEAPDRDETLSSRVGREALRGRRWALAAEKVIDGVFVLLGDGPGHCRRNIGT